MRDPSLAWKTKLACLEDSSGHSVHRAIRLVLENRMKCWYFIIRELRESSPRDDFFPFFFCLLERSGVISGPTSDATHVTRISQLGLDFALRPGKPHVPDSDLLPDPMPTLSRRDTTQSSSTTVLTPKKVVESGTSSSWGASLFTRPIFFFLMVGRASSTGPGG
jgi:hypothetical protein